MVHPIAIVHNIIVVVVVVCTVGAHKIVRPMHGGWIEIPRNAPPRELLVVFTVHEHRKKFVLEANLGFRAETARKAGNPTRERRDAPQRIHTAWWQPH